MEKNHIALSKQSKEPKKSSAKEKMARLKLDKYKPRLIDRLFKREEKKRILLEQEIEMAIKADENDYKTIISSWEKEVEEWRESVDIAEALLKGEAKAKIEAKITCTPFQRFLILVRAYQLPYTIVAC